MGASSDTVICDKVSLLAGEVVPKSPMVNVVEAKSDEAFGEGLAQTLAGLCAVGAKYGVLTDGLRWMFLTLDHGTRTYYASEIFTHQLNSVEILEILSDFCAGKDSPLLA
eukprot:TRINITY_DN3990_c0_g1_i2.p3 TRINITY_DN3990_c0_g1~~TRINITY_DN3990_c0_g1_i2.p3  ORF type:complete len:110 (+),score=9.75 TRINITY_DN3990_c0_g1_i2:618-947(+)